MNSAVSKIDFLFTDFDVPPDDFPFKLKMYDVHTTDLTFLSCWQLIKLASSGMMNYTRQEKTNMDVFG